MKNSLFHFFTFANNPWWVYSFTVGEFEENGNEMRKKFLIEIKTLFLFILYFARRYGATNCGGVAIRKILKFKN